MCNYESYTSTSSPQHLLLRRSIFTSPLSPYNMLASSWLWYQNHYTSFLNGFPGWNGWKMEEEGKCWIIELIHSEWNKRFAMLPRHSALLYSRRAEGDEKSSKKLFGQFEGIQSITDFNQLMSCSLIVGILAFDPFGLTSQITSDRMSFPFPVECPDDETWNFHKEMIRSNYFAFLMHEQSSRQQYFSLNWLRNMWMLPPLTSPPYNSFFVEVLSWASSNEKKKSWWATFILFLSSFVSFFYLMSQYNFITKGK